MDVLRLIQNDIDNFYNKSNYKKFHFPEHDLFTIETILKKTNNPEVIKRIKSYINIIDIQKELIDNKLKKKIDSNRVYLYFCRHAYSNSNYSNNILEIDTPLTSAGITFTKKLKLDIKPDYIFSSVLSRSQMTATCLFNKKINVVPFIKEYNYTFDIINKYYTNQPLLSPYTQYMKRLQGIDNLSPDIDYTNAIDENFLFKDITRLSGNINLFLLFLDTYVLLDKEKTIFTVTHYDTIKHFGEQFNNVTEIKNNAIFTLNKKGEKGVELKEIIDTIFYEKNLTDYEFVKVYEHSNFDRTKHKLFNEIDIPLINNLNFV